MHHKKRSVKPQKRHKCLWDSGWESKRNGSFVNNDTVTWTVTRCDCRCSRGVRTADCGRRSAVIVRSADWRQMAFLFRGRDVAITMNSVKILHAVRSAITAIAELLVIRATVSATCLVVLLFTSEFYSSVFIVFFVSKWMVGWILYNIQGESSPSDGSERRLSSGVGWVIGARADCKFAPPSKKVVRCPMSPCHLHFAVIFAAPPDCHRPIIIIIVYYARSSAEIYIKT